jgi:hypothetical protein
MRMKTALIYLRWMVGPGRIKQAGRTHGAPLQ